MRRLDEGMAMRAAAVCDRVKLFVGCCSLAKGTDPGAGRASGTGTRSECFDELGECLDLC